MDLLYVTCAFIPNTSSKEEPETLLSLMSGEAH